MKDFNLQLKRAYYAILKGNVSVGSPSVPVKTYSGFVPKGMPQYYIVIQSISSIGRESKDDQDREFSVQFLVSTRLELNSGIECDQIADQIYQLCYPKRGSVIDGCLSMDLVSDNTINDIDESGRFQIVERAIIFKHIITT